MSGRSGSESDSSSGSNGESSGDEVERKYATATRTDPVSHLAFQVMSDTPNPKGKKKEITRLRKFLGFSTKSVLLTLDDLGPVSLSLSLGSW
jgi:hypothetical protein